MALQSPSLRAVFVQVGITKLQDIVEAGSWCSAEEVMRLTGTHSARFIKKLMTKIQNVAPEMLYRSGKKGKVCSS